MKIQSCNSCSRLTVDLEIFENGMFVEKCGEFNFHVFCPLLSGWSCPRYQYKYLRRKSLLEKIKEKLMKGRKND